MMPDVSNREHALELLCAATELVVSTQFAGTSILQQRLGIGYGAALTIMGDLERRKIVTPDRGSSARDVLIDASALAATLYIIKSGISADKHTLAMDVVKRVRESGEFPVTDGQVTEPTPEIQRLMPLPEPGVQITHLVDGMRLTFTHTTGAALTGTYDARDGSILIPTLPALSVRRLIATGYTITETPA